MQGSPWAAFDWEVLEMDLQDHPNKELIQAAIALRIGVNAVLDAAQSGQAQIAPDLARNLRSTSAAVKKQVTAALKD